MLLSPLYLPCGSGLAVDLSPQNYTLGGQTEEIEVGGDVARMRKDINTATFFGGRTEENNHLQDLSIGGRILLYIDWYVTNCTSFFWLLYTT